MNRHQLYAGAVAGVMLWVFFTMLSLVVFLFAHLSGVEYAGDVIDYRELLLYPSVGVVFGGVYDILPGNRSTSKAIVFVFVLSLLLLVFVIPLAGFPVGGVSFIFPVFFGLIASSIVFGALLGWLFDIVLKRMGG